MKIAFFEILNEIDHYEEENLKKFFPGSEAKYFGESLNMDNAALARDAEIISIFTKSLINKEIIDSLPDLKYINTSSTGFEHIDLDYCKKKGIKVSNVPAYGSVTVAEFAFALILTLSRKISKANSQLRQDDNFNVIPLRGFDLRGKTLGVIGTGRIGKNVIKIAKGFEMNVIACDTFIDKALEVAMGFTYKSFEEIISESDIVTIHVPYFKENHHLINKENIKKMKRGMYLINTARGALVDTEALVLGLKEGIVAGAGLDVLEGERDIQNEIKILSGKEAHTLEDYKILLENHMLIDMPNVVVTPHIAFYSKEAEGEIIKTTIENIQSFISGSPINLIK